MGELSTREVRGNFALHEARNRMIELAGACDTFSFQAPDDLPAWRILARAVATGDRIHRLRGEATRRSFIVSLSRCAGSTDGLVGGGA